MWVLFKYVDRESMNFFVILKVRLDRVMQLLGSKNRHKATAFDRLLHFELHEALRAQKWRTLKAGVNTKWLYLWIYLHTARRTSLKSLINTMCHHSFMASRELLSGKIILAVKCGRWKPLTVAMISFLLSKNKNKVPPHFGPKVFTENGGALCAYSLH